MDKPTISPQTRNNWFIVSLLTLSSLPLIISSLYFLFLPQGGYRGGRNPAFGFILFFDRNTWDLLHTWSGVVLIAAAAIHIPLHWSWIAAMTKRIFKIVLGQCESMNARGQFNLLLNGLLGLSGLVAAVSGLIFLFFPGGRGEQAIPAALLFERATWDVIHTWAGTATIAAGVLHFAIHWRWILKVTRNLLFAPAPPPTILHKALG